QPMITGGSPMHSGGPSGSTPPVGAPRSLADLSHSFDQFRLDVNRRLDSFSASLDYMAASQASMAASQHAFFESFYIIYPPPLHRLLLLLLRLLVMTRDSLLVLCVFLFFFGFYVFFDVVTALSWPPATIFVRIYYRMDYYSIYMLPFMLLTYVFL